MKTKSIILHLIFLVIVVLELIGTVNGSKWLDYPVKPFILIWIAAYFLIMTKPQPYRWLVMLAFFFSWSGDLFLMFGWKSDMFFFAGVGGFFLSQVTYIQAFRKFSVGQGKGLIARKPLWALPFLIYLVGIYVLLYPHLEGIMKPVVALYAISLLGMSAAAFNRMGLIEPKSFWILFGGSVFFVISDSLLAINKFATPIPNEGFMVMATYMLAQYLIMLGLLEGSQTIRR
ncbi:MAG: lysoplasmalogenase [Porphyromonadaceae bacterium]|nr:MAG: lysoplasmalogenase [Porphyromonadaceae bacterium]